MYLLNVVIRIQDTYTRICKNKIEKFISFSIIG